MHEVYKRLIREYVKLFEKKKIIEAEMKALTKAIVPQLEWRGVIHKGYYISASCSSIGEKNTSYLNIYSLEKIKNRPSVKSAEKI